MRLRTILVDDHPHCRAGLRICLEGDSAIEIVGEAADAEEALEIVARVHPEVALVDVHLPGTDGIALTGLLRLHQPGCRVIGFSAIDEPIQIAHMLRAGAIGYVLKTQPLEAMVEAIRGSRSGIRYLPPGVSAEHIDELIRVDSPIDRLTPREREVFDCLLAARSNDDIALTLLISIRTVETHRQRVMGKLGVHSSLELLQFARRHGLWGR